MSLKTLIRGALLALPLLGACAPVVYTPRPYGYAYVRPGYSYIRPVVAPPVYVAPPVVVVRPHRRYWW
jgi:hypothetical protein